ncbi:hypothetical protein CC86DRAFT_378338 [Ophiobolus disseminans]|uniref:Protein kinase domain-containing protein n=1 Tax=Ophiobolus disseminans TaxID=1469910 RepID=A0A6A7AE26_9PLEO|nr:hypothetical protein CC86DRAFT_378338 [Ophiobolus disseminans]
MLEFYIGDDNIALTIMSRTKRYHILLTSSDLLGPKGEALQTFLTFKASMHYDPQAMEAFQDWLVAPCIPLTHIATPCPQVPTLAEYFAPETTIIKLANEGGRLVAEGCPDDTSVTDSLVLKISQSEPLVVEALAQGVPCVEAERLRTVMEEGAWEADYDLIPHTVEVVGNEEEQKRCYFKGAFEQGSFMRELDVLLRFRTDSFFDDVRVSRLADLVTSIDHAILVLLVDFIPGSQTIESAILSSSTAPRHEWARRVRHIVETLHSRDIVWGNVNPDNILIDEKGGAWVTDFSGGRVEGWVNRHIEGTLEGDLQGLGNVETMLGVESGECEGSGD